MASRIKKLHLDALASMKSIKDSNSKAIFKYFNIWDNQITEMILGDNYSYGTPAIFLELILGEAKQLSRGFTSYPDCVLKFHMINQYLNQQGTGSMEQNLDIFDIRDSAKVILTNANISYCASLMCIEEELDYKHGNIYKYNLSFKTNFIDSKGSELDSDSGLVWGYLVNADINLNVFKNWQSEIQYIANSNVVVYGNDIYIPNVDNNDIVFDVTKWIKIPSWISGANYVGANYVANNSLVYQCETPNSDLIFDPAKWILITN